MRFDVSFSMYDALILCHAAPSVHEVLRAKYVCSLVISLWYYTELGRCAWNSNVGLTEVVAS